MLTDGKSKRVLRRRKTGAKALQWEDLGTVRTQKVGVAEKRNSPERRGVSKDGGRSWWGP